MKKFETLRHSNKRIRFGWESKPSAPRGFAHHVKGAAGNMFQRPAGLKID
jgi:hypothetical protein